DIRRLLAAFGLAAGAAVTQAPAGAGEAGTTVDEARGFAAKAEAQLLELANRQQRASWVQATFITDGTENIAAKAKKDLIAATVELATQATRFDGLKLPDDVARKLELLKLSLTLPAPKDPKAQTELTEIASWLEGTYGKGKYCPPGKGCLDLGALETIMAESHDPAELVDVRKGWHQIGPPMRPRYEPF